MKIRLQHREHGVAVIVVLTLLSLMLLYIAANARTLYYLGRELKLIDRQQTQHWSPPPPKTNSPSK